MVVRQSLKTRLVEEAIKLLIAGEEEPSLRELAKRAGVSAMAPYRHFPTRTALIEAVAEAGFDMLRAQLEQADSSAQGRDALVAQGLAYVAFATGWPRLFRLMFTAGAATSKGSPSREAAHAVLTRRIAQVVPAGLPGAPLACWALVHGLAMLQLDAGTALGNDALRPALEVVVHGISRQ